MKVKVQGFIVYDSFSPATFNEFTADMTRWIDEGKVHYTEQLIEGLEQAPQALNDLLVGKSFGKMVVKV